MPASDSVTSVVRGSEKLQPVQLNALLNLDLEEPSATTRRFIYGYKIAYADLVPREWLNRPGTWQGMYPTDPPCHSVLAHLNLQLNTKPSVAIASDLQENTSKPDGSTIGALVETLRETGQTVGIRREVSGRST